MTKLSKIFKKINKFTSKDIGRFRLDVISVLDGEGGIVVATDGFRLIKVKFYNYKFTDGEYIKVNKDGSLEYTVVEHYPNISYLLETFSKYEKKEIRSGSEYDFDKIVAKIIRALPDDLCINVGYVKDGFCLYSKGHFSVELLKDNNAIRIEYNIYDGNILIADVEVYIMPRMID